MKRLIPQSNWARTLLVVTAFGLIAFFNTSWRLQWDTVTGRERGLYRVFGLVTFSTGEKPTLISEWLLSNEKQRNWVTVITPPKEPMFISWCSDGVLNSLRRCDMIIGMSEWMHEGLTANRQECRTLLARDVLETIRVANEPCPAKKKTLYVLNKLEDEQEKLLKKIPDVSGKDVINITMLQYILDSYSDFQNRNNT